MSLSTFIKVDNPVNSASVSYAFSHGANSADTSILSLAESQIINISASTFSLLPSHSIVLSDQPPAESGGSLRTVSKSIVPSSNPTNTSLPSSLIIDTDNTAAVAAGSLTAAPASTAASSAAVSSSSASSSAKNSTISSSTKSNGAAGAAAAAAGPWKPAFALSLLCLVSGAASLI